ncbi:MAG: isopeptide-forming domain-containing fimbrial protein [Gammaproteobacteria bacterium]|nr:isopeptide-forming domain-containing fimbrial protein [Gammaproteobacteria bacterium]
MLNTSTVINVDSITFYSDPARTTPTSTIEAGQTIYIETVVSDPFGAFDISDTRLTLIDPNNTEQISDLSMTEDAGAQTAGTKTFYYAYSIPPASSIAPGTWEAQITADEGSEGNVSHTDINQFTTTAPEVDVQYTVSPISASPGQTLTYTITIDNTGASPTTLDINSVPIPALTENLQVTTLPSGTNNSTASVLDITGINAAPGITTIEFTVDIVSGAGKGDVIDHTITLDNMGTSATDTAPSVLVNPFSAPIGNKYLYADAVGTTQILDRTEPTADTTDVVSSQGSSIVLTLAPVLDGDLTLEDSGAGTDIEASVWISQTSGATAERTIEATLGYTGASSGTIGTHSQTLTLASGSGGAQYIPFEFDLPADLTIAANSSLTLRIRNNSSVAGDTITVHSFEDGTNPSRVAFTAINPLTIADIRVFDNDIDAGGVEIGDAGPGDTVWIVATAEDPFGAPDITGAELTVTDPNTTVTLSGATMNVPSTQPASGAQRNFQLSHTLTSELGDWDIAVTADEGNEGLVSTSDSIQFNVNNLNPDVSNSYKTVVNETGSNNNAGDTLKYTITVSESGGATLTGVQVTDTFSSLVTYVPASLEVCEDTSPPSTCTPLTAGSDFTDDSTGSQLDINSFSVPPNGEVRISFDVTINSGVSPGDVISNDGNISSVDDPSVDVDVRASDIVIYGSSATGPRQYISRISMPPAARSSPGHCRQPAAGPT